MHDYSSIVASGNVNITAGPNATVRAIGDEPTVTGGALVQRLPQTTNPRLMRDVLAHIERNPETWNQGSWAVRTDCGTSYCYAGHAVAMVGGRINIEESTAEVATLPEDVRDRFTREHVAISAAARAVLGLEPTTAERLFAGGNTLSDLQRLVGEICKGAETAHDAETGA